MVAHVMEIAVSDTAAVVVVSADRMALVFSVAVVAATSTVSDVVVIVDSAVAPTNKGVVVVFSVTSAFKPVVMLLMYDSHFPCFACSFVTAFLRGKVEKPVWECSRSIDFSSFKIASVGTVAAIVVADKVLVALYPALITASAAVVIVVIVIVLTAALDVIMESAPADATIAVADSIVADPVACISKLSIISLLNNLLSVQWNSGSVVLVDWGSVLASASVVVFRSS